MKRTRGRYFPLLLIALALYSLLVSQNCLRAEQGNGEKVGIAVMSQKKNAVDRQLWAYLGQMEGIKYLLAPDTAEEFFDKLWTITKDGKKVEYLVILGHGSRDRPHIELKSDVREGEELVPVDFDLGAHVKFFKQHVETLRRGKEEYCGLKSRKKLSADEEKRLDFLARTMAKNKKTLEKEWQCLERLEKVRDVMSENSRILLLNCSAAATQEGLNFVTDIGRCFLWKGGGEVVASKRDLQLYQVGAAEPTDSSLSQAALSKIRGGIGWIWAIAVHGKLAKPGDYYVTGALTDWLNWVTVKIAQESDLSPYSRTLSGDFDQLLYEAQEGKPVALKVNVLSAFDSGKLTYFWNFREESTPSPEFTFDTAGLSEGLTKVKVRFSDERGREGEEHAYILVKKQENYSAVIELSNHNPEKGATVTATARLTEGSEPPESYWLWKGSDALQIVSHGGHTAQVKVLDSGVLAVSLNRIGEYGGKIHTLAESRVKVVPAVAVPLSVQLSPSTVTVAPKEKFVVKAVLKGGTGPYSYEWYSGEKRAGATNQSVSVWMTENSTLTVVVTDALGQKARASCEIKVLEPLTVTLTPAHVTVAPGEWFDVAADARGGTPPYICEWYIDNKLTDATIPTVHARMDEDATMTIVVTDSAGKKSRATCNITVVASKPSGGASSPEASTPETPPQPPPSPSGSGGGASGTYPPEPFNSLQLTYALSGATITSTKDERSFTHALTWKGKLNSGTLRISGEARVLRIWTPPKISAVLDVQVSVDGKTLKFSKEMPSDTTQQFDVAVPIPPGAGTGTVTVNLTGFYNVGNRSVIISGGFGK